MCNHSVMRPIEHILLTVEYFINAQAFIVASESFQGNHRALQGRETLDLVRSAVRVEREGIVRGVVRVEREGIVRGVVRMERGGAWRGWREGA